MPLYTFHRDKMFYPLELRDDNDARKNAELNPGTLKVVRWPEERIVWRCAGKGTVQ
jgi:hypothetical protein